ncbi:5-hydroxytryptamine receptor 2a [Plakobranchus ocellatus]|uniref:5-hydroxytryptamine receptor 2a n=1 Tax=Plakobranchus ocellatus TaxID=259542 RepID=A0AAV4B2Q0_9GAST|nr:5-hydroxytryptamine receptor 2a [Plakobranchus ocellatus]
MANETKHNSFILFHALIAPDRNNFTESKEASATASIESSLVSGSLFSMEEKVTPSPLDTQEMTSFTGDNVTESTWNSTSQLFTDKSRLSPHVSQDFELDYYNIFSYLNTSSNLITTAITEHAQAGLAHNVSTSLATNSTSDTALELNFTSWITQTFTSTLSTVLDRKDAVTAAELSTIGLSVSTSSRIQTKTLENVHQWSETGYHSDDTATPEVIAKVIVLVMICLFGTVGNFMVIWTVVKEKILHRPPFYFLLSLGVTDLSRAVFCLPVMIATVLHGSIWKHGEPACKLFAFATAFFVFSSALSLLAVAADRHISMLHPRAYRRRSRGGANVAAAVLIWIIAFSISFPPVIGVGRYVFVPEEAHCTFQHRHYSKNDSLSSAFVLIAIFFVTFLLYYRIYRFLRAHRRMRPFAHAPAQSSSWAFVGQGANGQAFINWLNGFGGQAPVRQEGQRVVQRLNFGRVVNLSTLPNKNEHLTRLFWIITLVFLFSWIPYCTVALIQVFSPTSSKPSPTPELIGRSVSPLSSLIASWLGYAQVAFCPITFFLFRGPAGKSRKISRDDYSLELTETKRKEFLLENHFRK